MPYAFQNWRAQRDSNSSWHGVGIQPAQPTLTPKNVAGATGLEPATFGFGDQCSSQLSYAPAI